MENGGYFQALPPDGYLECGWVGQLSGSVGGEVLPIQPDSKDLGDFARLPSAFNHGFEP